MRKRVVCEERDIAVGSDAEEGISEGFADDEATIGVRGDVGGFAETCLEAWAGFTGGLERVSRVGGNDCLGSYTADRVVHGVGDVEVASRSDANSHGRGEARARAGAIGGAPLTRLAREGGHAAVEVDFPDSLVAGVADIEKSGGCVGDAAWAVETGSGAGAIELGGDGGESFAIVDINIIRTAEIASEGGDRAIRGDGTDAVVSAVCHVERAVGGDGDVCWEMETRRGAKAVQCS